MLRLPPRLRQRWHPTWVGLLACALLWLQALGVQHRLLPGHVAQSVGWQGQAHPVADQSSPAAHAWEGVLDAVLDHPQGGAECLHLDQLCQGGAPASSAAAGVAPLPTLPLPVASRPLAFGGGAASFDARAPPRFR